MTEARLPKIVNVASVPQRSPFRYPGGKTWLIPYLRAWLRSLPARPSMFVEPFVGGGIVSLTVGFERLAERVLMVELDEDVAAVWKCILEDDAEALALRVREFDVSVESVREELAKPVNSDLQRAFNTVLRNRTFHGGILAPGSGLIKSGENGKGIQSRWYPDTLSRRILSIAEIKERFDFLQGDGICVLEGVEDASAVAFIDPPYTAGGRGKRAGRRLYKYNELDHERLFRATASLGGDFLMTYDNDPEVVEMARACGFDTTVVPMKNTHHAEMVELLIGRDVEWARRMLAPAERRLF